MRQAQAARKGRRGEGRGGRRRGEVREGDLDRGRCYNFVMYLPISCAQWLSSSSSPILLLRDEMTKT
jgi:hypothetical protein